MTDVSSWISTVNWLGTDCLSSGKLPRPPSHLRGISFEMQGPGRQTFTFVNFQGLQIHFTISLNTAELESHIKSAAKRPCILTQESDITVFWIICFLIFFKSHNSNRLGIAAWCVALRRLWLRRSVGIDCWCLWRGVCVGDERGGSPDTD